MRNIITEEVLAQMMPYEFEDYRFESDILRGER